MTLNKSLVFKQTPVGLPVPGQDLKLEESEIDLTADLNGGLLVKACALSLDPYMRGRMRDPSIKSYSPCFELGAPLGTLGVAVVVRSDMPAYKAGDHVYGYQPMSTYAILPAGMAGLLKVIENKEGLEWRTYCGAAGMPGQTARYGFYNIGKPVKGQTIFVSAASGAVGQIVAQLAKKEGLKVIGSAGSDAKVEWLNNLGCFDVTFNYKTESTREILEAHPIDLFFDNVGGETLEAVLDTMNKFGVIIACGSISGYNTAPKDRYPIRNLFNIIGNQLRFEGFIISGKAPEFYEEFYKTMPAAIASGEIKIREHVVNGLDNGEAFVDLLTGAAEGKVVYVLE